MSITTENPSEAFAQSILNVAFHASTGAFAGHLFSIVHPIGGAIFGVAAGVSSSAIGYVLNRIFGNETTEKIVKLLGEYLGKVLIALGVTLAAGYSMTLLAGLKLSLLMIPTSIISWLAFGALTVVASLRK